MDPDSCNTTPPMTPTASLDMEDFPPLSPQHDIFKSDLETFCSNFSCQGEVYPQEHPDCARQGPIRSGVIMRLCGQQQDPDEHTEMVELFGYDFHPALLAEDAGMLDRLFNMAREELDQLQYLKKAGLGDKGLSEEAMHFRQNLTHFMGFIQICVQHYMESESQVTLLLQRLKRLLNGMERLHEMLSSNSAAASAQGNKCDSGHYHVFHGHLDVYWAVLECLHIISSKFPECMTHERLTYNRHGGEIEEDMLFQCVYMILWEITVLAINRYNKVQSKSVRNSAFPCSCVCQVIILLSHLLHHRQQSMAKQSLWVVLMAILQEVLSPTASTTSLPLRCSEVRLPPLYTCTDRAAFSWWFVAQLVPLFRYDKNGIYNTEQTYVASNYVLIQEMVKKSLSTPEISLRGSLRCLLSIYEVWEANADCVLTLWEHFAKKLNDQFLVPGLHLTGFASINRTAAGLLEKAHKLATGDAQGLDSECSYHLFLRLLALHLTKTEGGWRQIKARIYMKFHGRRVHELSETGLQNVTLLFLLLAHHANITNVCAKLVEVYSLLPVSSLEVLRRGAIWRGTFAAILLHQQRAADISPLVAKLVPGFNVVCKELSGCDGIRYNELWTLLSFYVDSAQEVIDSSPALSLQEHQLIALGFCDLLAGCRENDLNQVLAFAQAVLTKHRILYKRALQTRDGASHSAVLAHYRDTSDALWKAFYEFLVDRSTSNTPPPLLADVAAGFALLVIDMPPSVKTGMQVNFQQVFSHFGWGESVNPSVSCRFLCDTLPNTACMERVKEQKDGGAMLVHGWLRCAWRLPAADTHIMELTRLMFRHEEMLTLMKLANQEDIEDDEEEEDGVCKFFMALDKAYNKLVGLKDKLELRDKVRVYFGDVSKYLPAMLKTCASSQHMEQIYQLGGYMAKYTAQIIYIKSKPDCILPVLIERLALPRALLNPNKPLPQHVTAAIRKSLFLYVQSLGRLDYQRDPYVQRKLRDILAHYMSRFPIWTGNPGSSLPHPLLAAFSETYGRNVSAEQCSLRGYLGELIVAEFISMKGSATPPTAALGWTFILELQKTTTDGLVMARDVSWLLSVSLEYLLLCDVPSLTSYASQCLQCCAERYRINKQQVNSGSIESALIAFVDGHIWVYQARLFRVLETVAALCPDLFPHTLLPQCTHAVKMCEAKRGSGVDKPLRLAYYNFLSHLGEEGQAVRSALLRDGS